MFFIAFVELYLISKKLHCLKINILLKNIVFQIRKKNLLKTQYKKFFHKSQKHILIFMSFIFENEYI